AVANNGPNQFAEMGDPNTDAGFRALAAQDSTLILAEANDGTSHLFTIGLNDHRVDPWMSAKLVAMMRAKWGNQHLVLIRSDTDAGHGVGSTRDQSLEEQADIYSFLLNRFGQPGFTLPGQKPANLAVSWRVSLRKSFSASPIIGQHRRKAHNRAIAE